MRFMRTHSDAMSHRLLKEFMTVKETVSDYTEIHANGKRSGTLQFTYHSPTHWGSDGICQIYVRYCPYRAKQANLEYWHEVLFNWSSGGTNKGFSNAQIANAMSDAFALATLRLGLLEAGIDQFKTKELGDFVLETVVEQNLEDKTKSIEQFLGIKV